VYNLLVVTKGLKACSKYLLAHSMIILEDKFVPIALVAQS
jgi:hypothetical protein